MVHLKGDDKTRYVAEMFNSISARYDLLNTLMSGGMHHIWRRRATKIATESGVGEALDLATGTGDFVLDLADRSEIVRVVGLDLAPKMLPLARNKAIDHGVSHKVHWILGDALTLPFPKDHFLCITVGFGLRNFSDMQTAIREMTRVVQPGGRVVILDIVAPTPQQFLGRVKINQFLKKKIRGLFSSDCLKEHVPVNQNRCGQIG